VLVSSTAWRSPRCEARHENTVSLLHRHAVTQESGAAPPVLSLSQVSKAYGGLRPLRVQQLVVAPSDIVTILGVDQPMAEVFVNLVTGASLPDAGTIEVFGSSTSSIANSAEWLAFVDRIGIVSERAVMLEGHSVIQNLVVPFSLDIEPPSPESRARAAQLAQEAGLEQAVWDQPVGPLNGLTRSSARLARALALDPAVMLLEHPTAGLDRRDVPGLARRVRSVAERRGIAVVVLTADEAFSDSLAGRVLKLDAASGRLSIVRPSRWFRRS
jgi:phospholipid/cholesterol/gamma-HCH transport system ATP-binding protein